MDTLPEDAQGVNLSRVLHELQNNGEWDLEEALFLSFNINLGFFERGILGLCRAMGARVTVIADAHMWEPDVMALKGAGTEFLLGLAAHNAAFHPKLVLLVGPNRVFVAIGSGNLTMGGWQNNSELWQIVTGNVDEWPKIFTEIAQWLKVLSVEIPLPPASVNALNRVSHHVHEIVKKVPGTETNQHLIHNLDQSIISQLPSGPVDQLTLAAPFFDNTGAAVSALLKRFRPARLTLILQPGVAFANPEALATVCAGEWELEVLADNSSRYRHAKLIEWSTGSDYNALIGSANLSTAALLKSANSGGNVELSILTSLDRPLWPEPELDPKNYTKIEDLAALTCHSPADYPADLYALKAIPSLFSAERKGEHVEVEISTTATNVMGIEYTNSPASNEWTLLGSIYLGAKTASFTTRDVRESAILRLRWTDPATGEESTGQPIPLSIPRRYLSRPSKLGGFANFQLGSREDLLGPDTAFLNALAEEITFINQELKERGSNTRNKISSVATKAIASSTDTFDDSHVAWRWELEQPIAERLGPVFGAFACGIMSPAGLGRSEDFGSGDSGDLDSDSEQLPDIATPVITVVDHVPTPPLDHHEDTDKIRRIRRQRIEEFHNLEEKFTTTFYLGLARLTLCFYCAGNWSDLEQHLPVRYMVSFLEQAKSSPSAADLKPQLDALTVVALDCIYQRLDLSKASQSTAPLRKLESMARHIDLEQVSFELLEQYVECLSTPGWAPLDAADVFDDVAQILARGELSSVMAIAEASGNLVDSWEQKSFQMTSHSANPMGAAMQVLPRDMEKLGIVATSDHDQSLAIVLWSEPDLFTIERKGALTWKHYRANNSLGMLRDQIENGNAGHARVQHGAFTNPIQDARDLALELKVSLTLLSATQPGTCPSCFTLLTPSGTCGTCES